MHQPVDNACPVCMGLIEKAHEYFGMFVCSTSCRFQVKQRFFGMAYGMSTKFLGAPAYAPSLQEVTRSLRAALNSRVK